MDLLDCIKGNTLPRRSSSELLQLLIMADRFKVPSCVASCIELLLSFPMTCDLALLFSRLPAPVSESTTFQSLIDSAHEFFAKTLKRLDVFQEDIGGVDQAIIETVLSRNDLLTDSEDLVYDFLMKWVDSTHFLDSEEEKHKFLCSHIRKLIRFPHMSDSKLSEFYECHPYLDKELAMEIKLECDAYKKYCNAVEKVELRRSNKLLYDKRFYNPLRHMTVEKPKAQGDEEYTTVWLKLDKDELRNPGRQYSNTFVVGDREFYLSIGSTITMLFMDAEGKPRNLGMRLHTRQKGLSLLEFKVKVESSADGETMVERGLKTISVLNRRKTRIGFDYLLDEQVWGELISDNNKSFVNGVVTLTATIRIIR